MPIIIRTTFNNQDWNGQCQNADRDRRLFQCCKAIVNVQFNITKSGQCTAECWEQSLCSNYSWYAKTNFGDRALGRAYFIYRDIDQTFVLWGKSTIKTAEDDSLHFRKFKPLPEASQVRGLNYKDLEQIGVPKWGSGTFRYISEETANILDSLVLSSDEPVADAAEEFWSMEGRKLLKRHITKERSPILIKTFKSQLKDFSCSACGFSFEKVYGKLGNKFIEAHHTTPISSLMTQTKMSLSDLVGVCSNCHRMLHSENPPLSVEELREILKKSKASTQ